jgi:hypothetical protein
LALTKLLLKLSKQLTSEILELKALTYIFFHVSNEERNGTSSFAWPIFGSLLGSSAEGKYAFNQPLEHG